VVLTLGRVLVIKTRLQTGACLARETGLKVRPHSGHGRCSDVGSGAGDAALFTPTALRGVGSLGDAGAVDGVND
jgi:hypothetical protein